MTNKKLAIILSIVSLSLIATGAFLIFGSNETNAPSMNPPNDFSEQQQPQANMTEVQKSSDAKEALTAEVVATHSSRDDCWTIISGKVYDLTTYIRSHPGGSVIIQTCGKDGTSLFSQRKDENGNAIGSGQPHSGRAQKSLDEFYIGDLSN